MTATDHSHLAELVSLIDPFDAMEAEHRRQVLDWIGSGAPLYRVRKPDHPPQHLVAYFVVTDPATGHLLLVDHINAGLRLPTGGHCEPGEPPWQTVQRECGEELAIPARESAWLDRRPLFVTVTRTRDPHGTLGVHTDVSLWFVVEAAAETVTTWDRTEFGGLHWMSPEHILATPLEQLDPHLHRFTAKYQSVRPDLDPAHLRERMVDKLMADQHITTAEVAAAMRAVPREHFMPDGVDLATAYDADGHVVTKRDEHGDAISSVSAPWLQGLMIEQSRIEAGRRVLEIGSGGYNAALLAEVVGPTGRVVTVDIDGDITDRAARLLDEAGYGRVRVVRADGNRRIPGETDFDAIVVTVGAWDIAPAWIDQLVPGGTLVVPLIMGGITRSIAFRRDGDRLTSLSAEVCGFVAMQGDGRHADTEIRLDDQPGAQAVLLLDGPPPAGTHVAPEVLSGTPVEVWSGETIAHRTSWADMYLWFASFMPGFCRIKAPDDSRLRAPSESFFPYGNVHRDSVALFVIRILDDNSGAEWGARGYGPNGAQAAREMVDHIQRWNRTAGPTLQPSFSYLPYPAGHSRSQPGTAVLAKRDGALLIHWPTIHERFDAGIGVADQT